MKITDWPSTHVNLVSGWALFVLTILAGLIVSLFNLTINESLYVTILITTGAWAGVAAPGALIGKRATTKPEMTKTIIEGGPPPTTTTITELTPKQAEAEEPPTYVVRPPDVLRVPPTPMTRDD